MALGQPDGVSRQRQGRTGKGALGAPIPFGVRTAVDLQAKAPCLTKVAQQAASPCTSTSASESSTTFPRQRAGRTPAACAPPEACPTAHVWWERHSGVAQVHTLQVHRRGCSVPASQHTVRIPHASRPTGGQPVMSRPVGHLPFPCPLSWYHSTPRPRRSVLPSSPSAQLPRKPIGNVPSARPRFFQRPTAPHT